MSKNKMHKFVGPSKKMMDALEDAGLNAVWPKSVESDSDLCIEATYYTGINDYEKIVNIDLRDRGLLGKRTTKADVDEIVAHELYDAWQGYDIDEEMQINLGVRGAPDAANLLEDLKEAERKLERFADVAAAVANGRPIPDAADNTEIVIRGKDAKRLCDLLERIAYFESTSPWNNEEKAFAKMIGDEMRNKIKEAM